MACELASELRKPLLNSATLQHGRRYINSASSDRANRNMQNFVELRRKVKVGLSAALRKRKKRSRQRDVNTLKEMTWKTRQAQKVAEVL